MSHGGIFTCVETIRPMLEVAFNVQSLDCSRTGHFGLKLLHFLKLLKDATRIVVNSSGPDVLYIHTALGRMSIRDCLLVTLFLQRFNLKVFVHVHSFGDPIEGEKNGLSRFFIRQLLSRASAIFTFSEKVFSDLNFHGYRSVMVNNPAPLKRPTWSSSADSGPVVIFVGSLIIRKGVDILARAVPILIKELPSLRIEVYGQGDFDFLASIEPEEIKGSVRVYGHIPNEVLADRICKSSVLVLPSRDEGMPMVILEALAFRTRVVSCDVGCIKAISTDSRLLKLVRHDPDELAAGILEMINMTPPDDRVFDDWYRDFDPRRIAETVISSIDRSGFG